MQLNIDYVSDVHLNHYVGKEKEIKTIDELVEQKIKTKINSHLLTIAGDINEDISKVHDFLNACAKYYQKVIFIAGNHEYYIPNMKIIRYINKKASEYDYKSINKIYKLDKMFKNNKKIVFLDKINGGIYNHNGFLIAGDTLWYCPKNIKQWLIDYNLQTDSRFIMSDLSFKNKIIKLHNDSINWYNNLPPNLDLIITHIPPIKNINNSCYYNKIDEYKAPVWIYGHDHIEKDIMIKNNRFVSNPWGYETKDFKIKTLTLKK